MARFTFDFRERRARPGLLPLALALVGAGVFSASWLQLQNARATEARLNGEIATLEQSRPSPAVRRAQPAAEAAQASRARVAAQLAHSWQATFDALATARSSEIALVSLDATQAKGQVKLVAEARRLADAVAFVEALQEQPGILRAALVQHEVRHDDTEKPVRFSVLLEAGT